MVRGGPILILAAIALTCGHATGSAAVGGAGLVVYPAIPTLPASAAFKVAARRPGGAWQPVPVYAVPIDADDPTPAAMASLATSGPVEVTVTSLKGPMQSAAVEPGVYNLDPSLSGDGTAATFTLPGPRDVSFEANGDRAHGLMLFASAPGSAPSKASGRRVVYFGPGAHTLPGNHRLSVSSGTTVYLAPGAIVYGTLSIFGARDVVVSGPGIVSPYPYFGPDGGAAGIEIADSSGVGVRDVTILRGQNGGITLSASSNVVIDGVREVNADRYGDGIDDASSTNVLVNRCFLRTLDDSIALWASSPFGVSGSTHDISIRNSTLWSTEAHGLLVGPYGAPNGHDVIQGVDVENVNVVEQDVGNPLYQGAVALEAGDSLTEQQIQFVGLHLTGIEQGRPIDVRVYQNPNENKTAGRAVRDVLFRNVAISGAPNALSSAIAGLSPTQTVSNVAFQGLQVAGTVATDAASGRLDVGDYTSGIAVGPAPPLDGRAPVAYAGRWSGRRTHQSTTAGSTMTLRFSGREAVVAGRLGPANGLVDVTVDGRKVRTIDTFSSQPLSRQTLFDTGVMAPGRHTVTLRVLGTHDALSSGAAIAVSGVSVLSGD
jgi:hypothetical protein